MVANQKFTPSTAKLCARKKDNVVFSLYLSNSIKAQANYTIKKVKGKLHFEIEAQNTSKEDDKVLMTAFIYKDDAKWNEILTWCVQEGLLTEDEAQAEM
jgi:hypothetical protein